jgi:acetyl-CoA carboxylase alpha subunit
LGIVDEMVPEEPGPAHRNPAEAIQAAGTVLKNWIGKLNKIPAKELFQDRIKRWKKIGHWDEVTVNGTRLIQEKVSRLPIINNEGFVQRHKDCYSKSGKHVYDPVNGSLLQKNNYVCDICGHRYARPSAWDYMDLILDQGTFNEHEETRYVIDKDILEFPGYSEILEMMKDGEKVKHWNHGMPTPASYERAIRAVDAANEEGRMIITFVDTPGADPTEESEAGGIAWRIGETIQKLIESNTPTLSLIINRGCSGGAIALTGCDCVLAMENSTYLVITPAACSSILFHTRHRANEAAEVCQITSREGFKSGIVDEMVPEEPGTGMEKY